MNERNEIVTCNFVSNKCRTGDGAPYVGNCSGICSELRSAQSVLRRHAVRVAAKHSEFEGKKVWITWALKNEAAAFVCDLRKWKNDRGTRTVRLVELVGA